MTKSELINLIRQEIRSAIVNQKQVDEKNIMREPVQDHNAYRRPIYHQPVLATEEDIDNFIFHKKDLKQD